MNPITYVEEFTFQEKVGEGTFGEVKKAIHKATKLVVAMKRIFIHKEEDGFPMTALREIRMLKKLQHENIVSLLSMCIRKPRNRDDKGDFFMVLPFMDHDLSGLAETHQFSVPQIKCYMKQLLTGLFFMHSRGIIHRDIKGSEVDEVLSLAANLLVNNEGILKIADFGLARAFEPGKRYTPGMFMMIILWYRPPEILLGCQKYTTAVDAWGAGCILAEMFRKQPILKGDSDLHQLELIARLCGTPNETNMKDFKSYKDSGTIKLEHYEKTIAAEFADIDPLAVDLIDKLLELDPHKRIIPYNALDHDFFWLAPPIAQPKDLPKYPSVHELDRRKFKRLQAPPPPSRHSIRPDSSKHHSNASTPVTPKVDERRSRREPPPPSRLSDRPPERTIHHDSNRRLSDRCERNREDDYREQKRPRFDDGEYRRRDDEERRSSSSSHNRDGAHRDSGYNRDGSYNRDSRDNNYRDYRNDDRRYERHDRRYDDDRHHDARRRHDHDSYHPRSPHSPGHRGRSTELDYRKSPRKRSRSPGIDYLPDRNRGRRDDNGRRREELGERRENGKSHERHHEKCHENSSSVRQG